MGIKRSHQEVGFFAFPERIAKVYYSHGLFCSSHPIPVICFACFVIILCCYPLLHLRLPGNSPQEHVTPAQNYSLFSAQKDPLAPKWFQGFPVGYILQILIKTALKDSSESKESINSLIHSSFRPVFDILETVRNYQLVTNHSVVSLDDVCLHVTESIHEKMSPGILPQYSCLILSPANFWKQDINTFLEDKNTIGTILNSGANLKEKPFLKDILLGVPWSSVRLNSANINSRAPMLNYAITLVLEKYDANFTEGLRQRLQSMYPMSEPSGSLLTGNLTHVYFHDQNNLIEFIPLFVTYIVLFLYIYFSVRKIELVKSKLGMAFSAVVTVIASLCMSIGICTWFGLSFTLKSDEIYLKEIFPYLVVIIGLENILVLTKSVVSTPVNLDVKVRVAQGLSKEGWSITKNLCSEITILTFGFFSFVPAIQEFCLFAVVGLLSDFFLQLVFFATILSIDVRRMEQTLYHGFHTRVSPSEQLNHMFPLFRCPIINNSSTDQLKKNRSSSRLSASLSFQQSPRVVSAHYKNPILVKVPKRLRLVYFWARCRIFQRAFMISFVVWAFLISYRSGIVEHFTPDSLDSTTANTLPASLEESIQLSSLPINEQRDTQRIVINNSWQGISRPEMTDSANFSNKNFKKQLHRNRDLWHQLSPLHWPTLFGIYNISIQRRYLSMLPPIPLSTSSEVLKTHLPRRFPSQMDRVKGQLKNSVDSNKPIIDNLFNERDLLDGSGKSTDLPQEAFYPSSPQEIILTIIFAIPSIIFVVYVMFVLYRCVCTRNYAEWRSSWSQETTAEKSDIYTQLVLEAMPIVLEGHPQEIECITTDDAIVVSSCLAGELRVWDSSSGECLSVIDRRRGYLRQRSRNECDLDDIEDGASDYGSGSPASRSEFIPDISHKQFVSSHANYCDPNHSPLHRKSEKGDGTGVAGKRFFWGTTQSQDNLLTTVTPTGVEGSEDVFEKVSHAPTSKDLFQNEPNLSSTIKTDFRKFSASPSLRRSPSEGYDFNSKFDIYYAEYRQLGEEREKVQLCRRKRPSSSGELSSTVQQCSWSTDYPNVRDGAESSSNLDETSFANVSRVWCLDCRGSLIAVGCSDGRIEVWDGLVGILRCFYNDTSGFGVTGICLVDKKIIASRLHGGVDFLELKSQRSDEFSNGRTISMHRRTHVRQGSNSSGGQENDLSWNDDVICILVQTVRAHQQPITELKVEGGRVVTGSQDHSLKVFRIEDAVCQLTLHGHHGPISALFIDKLSPMTAASGALDGAVCLWDLLTGACICRLQGHDGMVNAVTYTEAYVLSAGEDTRLLVWERFQGHLLNTINLQHSYCSNMVMLTDNLLLTASQGSLVVWDIRVGEPVRLVRLGHVDQSVFVHQIQHVGNAIVCDYGNQLRVVQFPTIVEKAD